MGFCFKLVCDCGYESNYVVMGGSNVSVFVPSHEELPHMKGKKPATLKDEGDGEYWSEETLDAMAKERFGKDAIVLHASHLFGGEILTCPRCGQHKAKFISTGISSAFGD
jgi:hypothetical protein